MLVEHSTRAADCVIPAPFAADGVLVDGWRRRSIDCIDCSEADANAWKPRTARLGPSIVAVGRWQQTAWPFREVAKSIVR